MYYTVKSAIRFGSKKLSEISHNIATLESRILLSEILDIEPNALLLLNNENRSLSEEEFLKFNELISRRLALEPIAYITKKREFFGRNFYVDNGVLIPRNDSEILIEAIINDYAKNENAKVLELGIGSGCLIITLLLEFENFTAEAIDISEKAVEVAQKNTNYHAVEKNRLNILQKDWNDYVPQKLFDIIISNPPYISKSYKNKELNYEPSLALYADNDGYAKYEEISKISAKLLKEYGSIYIEIGQNMEKKIEEIFRNKGFYLDGIYNDLGQINRCIKFKKINSKK